MELQKKKKGDKGRSSPNSSKKLNKKKKNDQNPTPSSEKNGSIFKYFERGKDLVKQQEQEERREENGKEEEEEETSKEDTTLEKEEGIVTSDLTEEDSTAMKKTFGSIDSKAFRDNIMKFKKMSRGIRCCIRSGFCSSHDCKVVRKVSTKKMSCIGVRWEVTMENVRGHNFGLPLQTDLRTTKGVY